MAHSDVLKTLGCADLATLVDPEFLTRFELNAPGQYGIATDNVKDSIRQLREAGSSNFAYAQIAMPKWVERGENRSGVEIELALGYSNHQQIELLGPGRNTSVYAERIPADGGMALHHVAIYQRGIDAIERRLNTAGYETVLSGDIGLKNVFTTRYRYFDTRKALGFYLEISEFLLANQHISIGERPIRFVAWLQKLRGA